jgi:hypothetical protein
MTSVLQVFDRPKFRTAISKVEERVTEPTKCEEVYYPVRFRFAGRRADFDRIRPGIGPAG